MSENWCTIESDPGVFTELIADFGVKDIEVQEVYTLEQEIEECYGLIFLFKYESNAVTNTNGTCIDPMMLPDLWFAKQIVTNACATQAILSVLFNNENIILGNVLENFKTIVSTFDSEMKGISIGNSNEIRQAHNSFAKPELFVGEQEKRIAKDGDDVYHFVAYIPQNGVIYELDGLKLGPIVHGTYNNINEWTSIIKSVIENRMQNMSTHFNLLSVQKSKLIKLRKELEETIDINKQNIISNEISNHQLLIESQKKENVRRRYNYLPFILVLLKELASKNKLLKLMKS